MIYRLNRILFSVLLLAPALSGCEERAKHPPPIPKEKLNVLASVYPLANLAEVVGGEHVAVQWVAESGQPIPFDDVPEAIRSAARVSDLLISSGEPWAVEGSSDPMRVHRFVRLDGLPAAATPANPRALLWLDPAVAHDAAEEIYTRLSAQRPLAEPYFRARADRFQQDLNELVQTYEPVLRTRPGRRALVLSVEWDRLLRRFDIEPIMPVEAASSALDAAQIRRLREEARAQRLTALLVHADTLPVVVRDLLDRTDLTILTLDPLGSSAAGGRNTYLELLRFNLDQLNRAASHPQN